MINTLWAKSHLSSQQQNSTDFNSFILQVINSVLVIQYLKLASRIESIFLL